MKIDVERGESLFRNWANVSARYTYAGTTEKPCLILTLELNAAAYEPALVDGTNQNEPPNQNEPIPIAGIPLWQQNALNDEENFSAICLQLERNYDALGISGISGQAVSVYLSDSLLKSEKTALSPEAFQSVKTFAADCLIYVAKRAGGWNGGATPSLRLEIPFSVADICESDVTELSLTLSFEARELPAISPPPTPETPLTQFECDIPDLTASLSSGGGDFVETFENIFHNEDWQMRIGKIASVRRSPGEQRSGKTLAIKIGKKPDAGFYYEIENQPVHYAVRPIAKTLESATVSIHQYDDAANSLSAGKATMDFTDIDLNAFAKTAFSAIDDFLSPCMINAVARIDSLLPGDSKTQGRLDRFWRHKETIAKAAAETVMPIFKSTEIDEIGLAAAREKFRQSLLIRLSNAFISNCAAVFEVSNVSIDRRKTGEILPGRFYGHFQKHEAPSPGIEQTKETTETTEPKSRDFLLSSGKIEYFQTGDAQSGDWRLPILFSTENDGRQFDFALPAAFALTHLELGRAAQADDGNAEEKSLWIQLTGAPIVTPIGRIEFPLIDNEVPSAPSFSAQNTDPNDAPASSAPQSSLTTESTIFDYPLSYEHSLSARDLIKASISISNQAPSIYANSEAQANSEAHPLFAALVQFALACNFIYADFEQYIGKLDANVIKAKKALDEFDLIFKELAAAYEQWANVGKAETPVDEQSSEHDSFDIVLKAGANGNARIDIAGAENSDSKSSIPFSIEIPGYIQKQAPDKPVYAAASYNYVLADSSRRSENETGAPVDYLSYEDALDTPHRTILLKKLNIFTDRNVSAQIQALANETVGTNETAAIDDYFKLSSPTARSENPDIFSLHFGDFDLSTIKISEEPTLENYLGGFFASLLKEAAGIPVWLKIAVSFSRQLEDSNADGARIVSPVALVPPTKVIAENGEPLPIVSALADQIIDWTKMTNPALEPSSEYNICLEIYAQESDRKPPLIIVDNAFIDISKITDKS